MKNFDLTCDCCGKRIVAKHTNSIDYHFYAYSGFVCCMDCYSTAVCSEKYKQNDIRKLEESINDWFQKRYGDNVKTKFYNYLEDAERILDMSSVKERVVVTDDHDTGVVAGLAGSGTPSDDIEVIREGEIYARTEDTMYPADEYLETTRASHLVEDTGAAFVMIKNGLPFDEYMGVLAHEMTHQWQFANLNFALLRLNPPNNYVNEFECVEDILDFRVEGMAEWERIQYMKKHSRFKKAYQEERILKATRNAYGYGYMWMCDFMKVGHDDPAIPVKRTLLFILKRNWYQLTGNSFALMKLYFGNNQ